MNEVHENSIAAYHSLDRDTRRKHVLNVYQESKEKSLTDREVATIMGFDDMNLCRPRITELIKMGFLFEDGKTRDVLTNKTVRKVSLCHLA